MWNLNDRLRELRKSKSLSQKDFSELIDVPRSSYCDTENGNRSPSVEFLKNVAIAFPDVSIEWLLTGSGEMLKTKPIVELLHEDKQTQRMIRMFTKLGESERQDVFCATERIHKISEIERELRELKNASPEKMRQAA